MVTFNIFQDQADYGGSSYYIGGWVGFAGDLLMGVGAFKALGKTFGREALECGLRNAPSSTLHAGNFGKAVRGVATHSADDATDILRKMAQQEFGVTAPILVEDAAKWSWKGAAGITGFIDGKLAVRILNGPLNQIAGTMRHEMTHVMQWIRHPRLMNWSTSPLAPGSTIGRFVAEWQAHSVHTFAKSPLQGALREAFSHPLQWGSDLIYVGILGGGVYYATRRNNP